MIAKLHALRLRLKPGRPEDPCPGEIALRTVQEALLLPLTLLRPLAWRYEAARSQAHPRLRWWRLPLVFMAVGVVLGLRPALDAYGPLVLGLLGLGYGLAWRLLLPPASRARPMMPRDGWTQLLVAPLVVVILYPRVLLKVFWSVTLGLETGWGYLAALALPVLTPLFIFACLLLTCRGAKADNPPSLTERSRTYALGPLAICTAILLPIVALAPACVFFTYVAPIALAGLVLIGFTVGFWTGLAGVLAQMSPNRERRRHGRRMLLLHHMVYTAIGIEVWVSASRLFGDMF